MSTICQEVQNMLKTLYDNDQISSYENTPENQVILHELLKSVTESEKISNMYLHDLNSKTREFATRSEKMRLCFRSAHLCPSFLESVSQSTLQHLAACGCILNLKDVNDMSYLLAMAHLSKEQLTVENEQKKEDLLHKKTSDSIEALMLRTEGLQKKLDLIGDQPEKIAAEMEILKHTTQALSKKSSSVVIDIALNEEHLKNVGLETNLLHGTLVKQSQKLREMEKKCDLLAMKLARFQGLPADRDLAIAEVEKLKDELKNLDMKVYKAASNNANKN